MSQFSLWLFRRMFRKAIRQNFWAFPVCAIFGVMHEEMRKAFPDDHSTHITQSLQEQLTHMGEKLK